MKLLSEPPTRKWAVIYGLIGTLGLLLIWEIVLAGGLVSAQGLPLPSRVGREAGVLLGNGEFWQQVSYTIGEWLLGLGMASVAGVLLGALMGAFSRVFIAFEFPVEVFRTLPSIAVGPILVLLMGAGMLPMSLTVAISCIWPILLNTMYGVRGADTTAVQTAQTFGVKPLGVLTQIKLVSALPFAFTGIRVAASIGLIVAVSAELLIGSGQGIGGYILVASSKIANLDGVYAATLIAGVLGLIINMLFAVLDNTVFGWKKGLAQ